jgi:nucleoid DNA-binding protein
MASVVNAKVKKKDIANEVARQAGVSKTDAQTIVDTVLDSLVDSLQRGEGIELRGFGTFRFHQRASRRGRNPKTGAEVNIPARSAIRFRPGKELTELLNGPREPGDD